MALVVPAVSGKLGIPNESAEFEAFSLLVPVFEKIGTLLPSASGK